jgi:hypothetical protein
MDRKMAGAHSLTTSRVMVQRENECDYRKRAEVLLLESRPLRSLISFSLALYRLVNISTDSSSTPPLSPCRPCIIWSKLVAYGFDTQPHQVIIRGSPYRVDPRSAMKMQLTFSDVSHQANQISRRQG